SLPRSTLSLYLLFFFFTDPATTDIYTLFLHDALPIFGRRERFDGGLDGQPLLRGPRGRQKRGEVHPRRRAVDASPTEKVALVERSEEHTSELQSRFDLVCRLLLEKKKTTKKNNNIVSK